MCCSLLTELYVLTHAIFGGARLQSLAEVWVMEIIHGTIRGLKFQVLLECSYFWATRFDPAPKNRRLRFTQDLAQTWDKVQKPWKPSC